LSEAKILVDRMSINKALSFDLFSDIIFSKRLKEKTINLIRSLWNPAVTNSLNEAHFESRLIPLNKKHPDVPKAEEFRPIVVMSPLVKLLEARLLEKLQWYTSTKLQRSQTGFVPGMDIFVNIHRALDQIRLRINDKKKVFCLFLDFKSAYNTVPHDELFQKLNSICSEEEVQLLRAIYSRMIIKLGSEKLRCNVGVAQGSMISPALFDLYAEDLITELIQNGWNIFDILAYADDHLILCDSIEELEKAISTVKSWCQKANILLNPTKSGILEVVPRRGKISLDVGTKISDIPVVQSYRYLGLLLDGKLTGDLHIQQMNKKIYFLNEKLAPLLTKVSLDYRINLWKALVRPLYNSSIAIMYHNNLTRINKLESNMRMSFKRFVGLSITTSNSVLNCLIDFNIKKLADDQHQKANNKWQRRLALKPILKDKVLEKIRTPILPKLFIKYNNIQKSKCPVCRDYSINDANHLKTMHNIQVPSTLELLNNLCKNFPRVPSKGFSRSLILLQEQKYIQRYLNLIIKHTLNKI